MELLSTEETLGMWNCILGPVTAQDVRDEAADRGLSVVAYIAECVAEVVAQCPPMTAQEQERILHSLCRSAGV